MPLEFKSPKTIGDQYLTHLKGLKPDVNTDQTDSDWWIRSRVIGGVVSGLYADQLKIADDAFPQSARREAVDKSLFMYLNDTFKQPTVSEGSVLVSGATGSFMPALTAMVYSPNGNQYQTTADITLSAVTGIVPVKSIGTGQAQNLLSGSILNLTSPPGGFNTTATVQSGGLADGRDLETTDEAASRVLKRIQNPISGGTKTDYEQWAVEADASVVNASAIRFLFGLGTVGVVFTAGTTDIDTAVTNGDAVVRIPSDALVDKVQAYIDAKKPLTDCAHVIKPVSVGIDVTVKVRYSSGDGSTIPGGQTLTQEELVKREVKRAIYKTPPGGRVFGGSGFVVASEIEEVIDLGLSDAPYTEGSFVSMLVDRQVEDLSATGTNRMILNTELCEPGTITVVQM